MALDHRQCFPLAERSTDVDLFATSLPLEHRRKCRFLFFLVVLLWLYTLSATPAYAHRCIVRNGICAFSIIPNKLRLWNRLGVVRFGVLVAPLIYQPMIWVRFFVEDERLTVLERRPRNRIVRSRFVPLPWQVAACISHLPYLMGTVARRRNNTKLSRACTFPQNITEIISSVANVFLLRDFFFVFFFIMI